MSTEAEVQADLEALLGNWTNERAEYGEAPFDGEWGYFPPNHVTLMAEACMTVLKTIRDSTDYALKEENGP